MSDGVTVLSAGVANTDAQRITCELVCQVCFAAATMLIQTAFTVAPLPSACCPRPSMRSAAVSSGCDRAQSSPHSYGGCDL